MGCAAGTVPETVQSVRTTLLNVKYCLTEMLATLNSVKRIDENLKAIGRGNPYRLVRCPGLSDAVDLGAAGDEGFAAAVAKACEKADPLSKAAAYLSVALKVNSAICGVERRIVKIQKRIELDPGTEAEADAARSLSESAKESLNALRAKLAVALGGYFDAKRKTLETLVSADERLAEAWPSGSADLRTAVLSASCASAVQTLAMNETVFARGEKRKEQKRVRI